MWEIWNKQTPINGVSAERCLQNFNHLVNEETIFIKYVNGRAVQVEGKNIIASIYGINPTLDNQTFIEEYEKAIVAQKESVDIGSAPYTYEETDIPIETEENNESEVE
jgi:hypothetical protein